MLAKIIKIKLLKIPIARAFYSANDSNNLALKFYSVIKTNIRISYHSLSEAPLQTKIHRIILKKIFANFALKLI